MPLTRVASVPSALLAAAALLATLPGCPEPPTVPWPPDDAPRIVPGPGIAALARLPSRAATPHCGAALEIAAALVDPTDVPDREGEWLAVANSGIEALDLDGWTLAAGRRRLRLPPVVLAGGETLRLGGRGPLGLGSLRLRNGSGAVALADPCGLTVSRLAWGCPGGSSARPGEIIWSPAAWGAPAGPEGLGPARDAPGGADGGCGQT